MPRGPVLTPEVERIIGDVYIKHPELRAKTQKFYEEVYRRVHEQVDWAEPNWPGLSVVKKRLSTLREKDRNRPPESTELDEIWSLCYLPKYPIPAEALPLVMSIWDKCLVDLRTGEPHFEFWHLTVREALWIGRLYKVLEFYYHKQMAQWTDPKNAERKAAATELGDLPENYRDIKFEDILLDWAYVIANSEEYSEIEGEPFYEGEFDVHMVANVFEYYGERRNAFIYNIAEWYGIDSCLLTDPGLSITDIERVALKAFIESEYFHLLHIPKTKMSELRAEAREALELDNVLIIEGGLVTIPVKKGVGDEFLRKLFEYNVDIKNIKEIEAWGELTALAQNIIKRRKGGAQKEKEKKAKS